MAVVPDPVRPWVGWLGWALALVVLIFVWAAFVFGRVDLPLAFVVSAICAVRL